MDAFDSILKFRSHKITQNGFPKITVHKIQYIPIFSCTHVYKLIYIILPPLVIVLLFVQQRKRTVRWYFKHWNWYESLGFTATCFLKITEFIVFIVPLQGQSKIFGYSTHYDREFLEVRFHLWYAFLNLTNF